ncbi:MAG: hypothetical protein ABJB33_04600, partial [Gemmatimonadota bacterium]
MSLLRRTVPMLALIGVSVGSLAAQIPINRGRSSGASTAPRLLVATPYTDRAADSASAVAVGAALRARFERVVGTAYFVIPRDQMNRALAEFSYPADAILTRESAYRLTTAMQARTMLFTELGREGGRLRARTRLSAGAEDPGNTLTVRQAAGQTLQQFGDAIAVAFTLAVRAQADAKACMDQVGTDTRKATESATKAVRVHPANGLAHYCLAQLARARSAADPAYGPELDLAVKGDSLALKALGELADWHTARSDTANIVLKYQQMIEAAPTNRALIERASRVFRSLGRPDAAEQVADRGIALDSLDTAMWDLRSSACIFQQKYTCSVSSLEQIVAIDSTRADSNFLFRLAVTAGAVFADSAVGKDSVHLRPVFLKWAKTGAERFPANKNLVGQLLQAYSVNLMTDSVLSTTDRVLALDSTDVTPALSAIEILLAGRRWADAARYGALVGAKGDDQQKLAIAVNFTNTARTLLSTAPTDPEAAYTLLHVAIPAAGTDQRIAPIANFLMGYAGLQTTSKYDSVAEAGKSCDIARRMDGMLDEARNGFTVGRAINPTAADPQLVAIATYKQRTQTMIRAYCR